MPAPAALTEHREEIEILREALRKERLTLYLGAGVSKAAGLPTWDELVLSLYFAAAQGDWKADFIPYPNYLYAISDWHLRQTREPPEITAQRISALYESAKASLDDEIPRVLYGSGPKAMTPFNVNWFLDRSPLLRAIAGLCAAPANGVRSVVTYNYDNLLELELRRQDLRSFSPIWRGDQKADDGAMPILHVHGIVELGQRRAHGVILTEGDYHAAANNPYSWSNLCQLQCMSSTTGLMVGLSLTDRNMRRLFHALKATPVRQQSVALLKKPEPRQPKESEWEEIRRHAERIMPDFPDGGMKSQDIILQMRSIFDGVTALDQEAQKTLLGDLGIRPVWYDRHDELPEIIRALQT